VLALFLPIAAALYMPAEALNPKGTDFTAYLTPPRAVVPRSPVLTPQRTGLRPPGKTDGPRRQVVSPRWFS
jgi:hypothetical protein